MNELEIIILIAMVVFILFVVSLALFALLISGSKSKEEYKDDYYKWVEQQYNRGKYKK